MFVPTESGRIVPVRSAADTTQRVLLVSATLIGIAIGFIGRGLL